MNIAMNVCPFCRSRCVTLWTETDGNNVTTDAWVECDDCGARGPTADTEEMAVEKWNADIAHALPSAERNADEKAGEGQS